MLRPKIDLIYDGNFFRCEFLHDGSGHCPYCFLDFMHQHPLGSKPKEFIKINLPKQETWEDRFDTLWYEIQIGVSIGHPYIRYKDKLKDFIRKEFI